MARGLKHTRTSERDELNRTRVRVDCCVVCLLSLLGGFLDFLVSDHEHAVALRDHVTFVIVPMLNPDGCYHGNYRTWQGSGGKGGSSCTIYRTTLKLTTSRPFTFHLLPL